MTDKPDAYEWWRNALAGNFGPVHDGDPQPGFYRKRKFKAGPWVPVAIWFNDAEGMMLATADGAFTEADDVWSWVCKNPVSHEDFMTAVAGGGWPDDIPPERPAHGIGHNNPPSGAAASLAKIEETERDALKEIAGGIKDQAQSDRAANWGDRLRKLGQEAETSRKAEKKPHDDAGKEVQARWVPVVDRATVAAGKVRSALTAYLNEQDRKAQEQALQTGAPVALPTPSKVKAGTGARSTALRTIYSGEITDYEKALAHFANHAEIRAVVQKLANAAARSQINVPGVEIKERKEAA